MAAEIRVDTIKGRSGINTFSFKGDGFGFDQKVGIGTTVASDPVTTLNQGKLSVGIASVRDLYVGLITSNYGSGYSYVNVGTGVSVVGISTFLNQVNIGAAATFNQNGNATFSGIVTATQFQGGGIGVGIKTTGGVIGYGFTTLNFIGTGNTFATSGNTVDISIAGGGGGGVSEEETAVSSTSATAVGTFAKASFRSAAIIAQITQGSAYQMGRYLLIHDGTTVTVVEEAAVATGSMLGTFSGAINGSNVEFKVTMGSSSSATVTVKIDTVSIP